MRVVFFLIPWNTKRGARVMWAPSVHTDSREEFYTDSLMIKQFLPLRSDGYPYGFKETSFLNWELRGLSRTAIAKYFQHVIIHT